ncbi:MAG: biotin transporter BioY [Mesoaciditoga sp.]|uniref:biotin transporter BioY n=2 Tax=Athalassotoga sp. TaxID=2022597 RepID=UPI000CCB689B|nr:MAG: biotin transporter BioY [Mesoaciditoga sp.]HEU24392.1 biotin transporter BioY [Mesoaciditoga lauensis]
MKISRMAIWLAIVSLLSTVSISIGPVPLTLQVFAIFLMAFFLSPLDALVVMIGYTLLGAIGLPVFAGSGGIGTIISPVGGYILGFIPSAAIASFGWKKNGAYRFVILSIALLTIYIFGVGVLYLYLHSLRNSIKVGFLPFIWIDAIKISLVFPLANKISKIQSIRSKM